MLKRLFLLFCMLAILFAALSLPICAGTTAAPSVAEAESVLFLHLQSETEILSSNKNAPVHAGATVKTMSGLVLCELLAGRTSDWVSITDQMVSGVKGYRYGFAAGDSLTAKDLLYAAICGGYNDAYQILAYYTCGSPQELLNRMNTRAVDVGANNTHFADYTGIEDASVTTASDLMKIALSAYKNDFYLGICSAESYTLPSTRSKASTKIDNRNGLISSSKYHLSGCLGICAGTTDGSDALVAIANRDGEGYACVVLGCKSGSNLHYTVASRLFDWAYRSHTYLKIINKKDVITRIPITVSDQATYLDVKTDEDFSAYLPSGATVGKEVTLSIRLTQSSLEAPVADHTFVGYVAVQYNSANLAMLPLYTAGSAERSSLISRILSVKILTENRGARAGIIFFVLAMGSWVGFGFLRAYRRRHKWDKYFSDKTEYDLYKQNKQK